MNIAQPHIFTVYAFQIVDGQRRLNLHYVAGMCSADAEVRIKSRNAEHLTGQCFVTTDEHESNHGDGCKLYTTRYTNEPHISDADFRGWVRRMTRPVRDAGDTYPAPCRRFHVEGSRKSKSAELSRLAA